MKINLSINSRFKSYSVIIQDKGVNKSNLKPYVANRNNILIISDSGIPKKYINDLKKTIRLCGASAKVLTISNGEQSKSFKNYQYILGHKWFCGKHISQRHRFDSNSNNAFGSS